MRNVLSLLTNGTPLVLIAGLVVAGIMVTLLVTVVRAGRRRLRRVATTLLVTSLLGGVGGQGAVSWVGAGYQSAVTAVLVSQVAHQRGWVLTGPVQVAGSSATFDAAGPDKVCHHVQAAWAALSASQVADLTAKVRSGATPAQLAAVFPQVQVHVS